MADSLQPAVINRLLRELSSLIQEPPEGIHVVMNEADVTDVQAVIEGPEGTPFEGGQFQMRLVLGPEFPAAPPKGYFITKIFHPNVSKTGEICVNTLKRDWKPDIGLRSVFITIKCLLIAPNPESALNEEAGRLQLEAYDEFAKTAKLMTSIHAMRRLVTPTAAPTPMVTDAAAVNEDGENVNTNVNVDAAAAAAKAAPAADDKSAARAKAATAAKKKALKRL